MYGVAALALLLTAPHLSAQTTAALAGRVTDDTNASIVEAKVTIVNEATKDAADRDDATQDINDVTQF